MRKNYEAPSVRVEVFKTRDIITVSNVVYSVAAQGAGMKTIDLATAEWTEE